MKDFSMDEVGGRIRDARRRRGMTQNELSLQAEVDRKQISRMENGQSLLQMDGFKRMADALGVSVDYLLTGGTGDDAIGRTLEPFSGETRQRIAEGLAMIIEAVRRP